MVWSRWRISKRSKIIIWLSILFIIKEDEKTGKIKTKLRWNVINSIDHPYIKSLKVEDKGVKKAHIQLFDKDFASYQFGILKPFETKSDEKVVYSLDTLIKRSLMMPETKNEEQTVQQAKDRKAQQKMKAASQQKSRASRQKSEHARKALRKKTWGY